MVKPIYLYQDQGVSEVGVLSLRLALEKHLQRPVLLIDAEYIIHTGLSDGALLIMPGGADLPYCAKLNGEGNRQIRRFIERGGAYLGICAGAYYACSALDFIGRDYTVSGSRELALFNGTAKGSLPHLTNGRYYEEGIEAKAMVRLQFEDGGSAPFYYHGGCCFEPQPSADFRPIAYYPDGTLAMIEGNIGAGYYFLSGVHFELQAVVYRQKIVNGVESFVDKVKEQAICAHFTENYGVQIWQRLQKRLK